MLALVMLVSLVNYVVGNWPIKLHNIPIPLQIKYQIRFSIQICPYADILTVNELMEPRYDDGMTA
jgi:hypothetical protein